MSVFPSVGDRIRMVGIMEDPDPMPVGAEGTVRRVNELSDGSAQIFMDWDNGRSLILLDMDPFTIIGRE